MFGSAWDCFMLTWDNFSLTHLPPTSLNHPSPFPEIMIGTKEDPNWCSAIFPLYWPIFWLRTVYPCTMRRKLVPEAEEEVANWASGGSKSFDRSQNLPKFGFFQTWSEASGDVWDGFGWEKSCLYWSLLMFGSAWDCFMLTWDNFSLTHLPPTSLNHLSPFPDIMIGTKVALP